MSSAHKSAIELPTAQFLRRQTTRRYCKNSKGTPMVLFRTHMTATKKRQRPKSIATLLRRQTAYRSVFDFCLPCRATTDALHRHGRRTFLRPGSEYHPYSGLDLQGKLPYRAPRPNDARRLEQDRLPGALQARG